MKIVVVSDSHGRDERLDEILLKESDADCFIHCGDIETPEDAYPMFHIVKGNNDFFYTYPQRLILPLAGHRAMVVHGDRFPYMRRLERMVEAAKQERCDIVCFGHTHVAMMEQMDGVLLLNPGSLWRARDGRGPSYAIMQIEGDAIQADIKFLK